MIPTITSSGAATPIRSSEKPGSKRFDARLWDSYAPYFDMEEGEVFPVDARELLFYASMRASRPGRCLEIGAGSGRLATSLGGAALCVGIEPSAGMLRLWDPEAEASMIRVRALGQAVPFRRGSFDLIVFPYNGLHCVLDPEDRKALADDAAGSLAPGGRLLMETCPAFSRRPIEVRRERYRHRDAHGDVSLVESVRRDPGAGTIVFDMEYRREGLPPESLELELALLDERDVVDLLVSSGLEILELWGDYNCSPFDPELSPRLLALAGWRDAST